ncbi:reverse transcriptase domain-containing protein [Tanacetum coccineum]
MVFCCVVIFEGVTLLPTIVAQVGDKGRGQGNGRNQYGDAANDHIRGDVGNDIENNDRRGCTYKEFLACHPKKYDSKGVAIVYTRWIEKKESVQDMSGCRDNQKLKYTAGSFVGKALTWWNSQIHTRSREAAVGMSWEDFKTLTRDPVELARLQAVEYVPAPVYVAYVLTLFEFEPFIGTLSRTALPTLNLLEECRLCGRKGSVKHQIDELDEKTFTYKYTLIEGMSISDKIEKVSYDIKFEGSTDGGTISKMTTTIYTHGDFEIKEEN